PGAAGRFRRQAGASEDAGRMDAQLPTGRAIRRNRAAGARVAGVSAEGRVPHGRESAYQWRAAVEGPATAGFSQVRREVKSPGAKDGEATKVLGDMLRDVLELNADARNFRIFGPDETASNRLQAVFEATDREWMEKIIPNDDHLTHTNGRVLEVLSEHMCQGWLEAYLLTGRHGFFSCY